MEERTPAVPAPLPDSFWATLAPEDAGALAELCAVRTFPRGRVPFYAGDSADRVLILRTGWVKVHAVTGGGHEVVLAFRGPGDLIGELAALDDEPRSATIRAEQDVQALTLSHQAFRAFLASRPSVALVLLQLLGRRLRDADAKRIEFLGSTTIQRVAARLLEFADRFGRIEGDAGGVLLPLTQEDLAGAAYASLESVGRALKSMRTVGCIETARREIRIVDPDKLRALRDAAL